MLAVSHESTPHLDGEIWRVVQQRQRANALRPDFEQGERGQRGSVICNGFDGVASPKPFLR